MTESVQFQIGSDENGNLIMGFGTAVTRFTPVDAIKIAGTICAVVSGHMHQGPASTATSSDRHRWSCPTEPPRMSC